MATKQINQYTAAVAIDAVNDYFLVDPAGTGVYKKINRNTIMGVTGTPADLSTVQVLTNKTIGNTNTITSKASLFKLQDQTDTTKQGNFSLAGITTATTRTWTLPNANVTLASLTGTETLTNKTITSPAITGGTIFNTSIAVDSISEFTSLNGVTVGGVSLKAGIVSTASSVGATAIANAAVQPQKLVASTGTGWAMSSWVPTLGGATLGNGVVEARYIQIGKLVYCRFRFTLGTTSAITGDMSITLPVTAIASYTGAAQHAAGNIYMTPAGSPFFGLILVTDTTHAFIEAQLASGTYVAPQSLSASIPAVWASTNWMAGEFWFEAA